MLTDEEKREVLRRVLFPLTKRPIEICDLVNTLAREAIVIECEVEHIKDTSGWQTLVNGDFVSVPEILRPIPMFSWQLPGKHGKPG